jgi:LmbE family N-acetylglucosaminyl deacetylase
VANAGVGSWQEYADLRRRELRAALETAGVQRLPLVCLGYADQEASFHMGRIARQLARLLRRFRARLVFTHPYEGGHPDHDACAAAARFALQLMDERTRPHLLEFASYHASPTGSFETERLLGRSKRNWKRPLTEEQRRHKRDVLSRYTSQQRVLQEFPLEREPIREAPRYCFAKPPQRGKLLYENFTWGITGRRWRTQARKTMKSLGLQ